VSSYSSHQTGPSRPSLLLLLPASPADRAAGSSKDLPPHKMSLLPFQGSNLHREGRGVEINLDTVVFSLKFHFFFLNNRYRKPKPVSGQSLLPPPNRFPPPPQPSPLLSDPSRSAVGGLAVLPRAVF